MQIALFSLRYTSLNLLRSVFYEDSPRAIVAADEALDPAQPIGRGVDRAPDSWPYADQALIQTRYEGTETVTLTATRVYPYATFSVAATPPDATCDLGNVVVTTSSTGFSFTASTTHPPISASLSPDAASFVAGKTTFNVAPNTPVTLYLRDALGCSLSMQVFVPPLNPPPGGTSFPPAGAILLRRYVQPSHLGPDYYHITTNYYDKATRTASEYYPGESTQNEPYSRPKTDIIDRWCVAPGVAPFRETQVTHDGNGGVVFTNVDNVATCQVSCTLTLALAATATASGVAELTATAGSAKGAVEFSLDGFDTAGLPPGPQGTGANTRIFPGLKPATYTVTCRETRAGGCAATATVTITAAYGPRFELPFTDRDNTAGRLRLFQREYTGVTETLTGGPDPISLDWPGGATDHVFTQLVRGSQAALALLIQRDDQLLALYSGDERLFKVEVERPTGTLLWRGYLLPEQYDVAFLAPPNTFSLQATDGLGTLASLPFTGPAGQSLRGDWRVLDVLLDLLGRLDLALPLNALVNLFPSTASPGAGALEQIRVDVNQYRDDKDAPWTCGRILTELLTSLQARLYQYGGAWWIERLSDLGTGTLVYASYSPTGTRQADVSRTSAATVSKPALAGPFPYWEGGGQRQALRPAVSRVTVKAEPGAALANLARTRGPVPPPAPPLPPAVNPPLAVLPANWTASANAAAASKQIYQGPDKAPLLRLVGTSDPATPAAAAPWVQTPVLSTVPIRDLNGAGLTGGAFAVSFTATPYGNTPAQAPAQQAAMYVALRFGANWVTPGLTPVEDPATPALTAVVFPDAQAVSVRITGYGSALTGPQPMLVRLVAPVTNTAGTATTVDITNFRVEWLDGSALGGPDAYASVFTAQTGQLVSRTDAGLTVYHADTPFARHAGTLLDFAGLPVQGWTEPAAPGQVRALGDYLVRDRALAQRFPAQALTGRLRGTLAPAGPGCLLTDPAEARPAVYALPAATYSVLDAAWQVSAVQVLGAVPAGDGLPDGAIYNEDLTAWQGEDGRILVYETAL